MLTYLTAKGLTDAQIQLISGQESKKSLEVYQHLSLESVDKAYQEAVQKARLQRNPFGQYKLLEPVGTRSLIIPKDDRQTLLSGQRLYGRETSIRVTRIDQ
jgi:hypothetical protein